jgi:hypothetical protein
MALRNDNKISVIAAAIRGGLIFLWVYHRVLITFKTTSMKKYWKVIGISALVAGALYYPAMKLYKYIAKRRAEGDENTAEGEVKMKAFSPAYRGKYKPHHRHAHNGDANTGAGLA